MEVQNGSLQDDFSLQEGDFPLPCWKPSLVAPYDSTHPNIPPKERIINQWNISIKSNTYNDIGFCGSYFNKNPMKQQIKQTITTHWIQSQHLHTTKINLSISQIYTPPATNISKAVNWVMVNLRPMSCHINAAVKIVLVWPKDANSLPATSGMEIF